MIRIANKVQQRPANIQAVVVGNQVAVQNPRIVRKLACRSPISPSKQIVSIRGNVSRNLRSGRNTPNTGFRRNYSADNLYRNNNGVNIKSFRPNGIIAPTNKNIKIIQIPNKVNTNMVAKQNNQKVLIIPANTNINGIAIVNNKQIPVQRQVVKVVNQNQILSGNKLAYNTNPNQIPAQYPNNLHAQNGNVNYPQQQINNNYNNMNNMNQQQNYNMQQQNINNNINNGYMPQQNYVNNMNNGYAPQQNINNMNNGNGYVPQQNINNMNNGYVNQQNINNMNNVNGYMQQQNINNMNIGQNQGEMTFSIYSPPNGQSDGYQLLKRGAGIGDIEFSSIIVSAKEALRCRDDPLSNGVTRRIKEHIGGEWFVYACVGGLQGFDFNLSDTNGNEYMSFIIDNFHFQVCRLH